MISVGFSTGKLYNYLAKQPQVSKQQTILLFRKASKMRFCGWGS